MRHKEGSPAGLLSVALKIKGQGRTHDYAHARKHSRITSHLKTWPPYCILPSPSALRMMWVPEGQADMWPGKAGTRSGQVLQLMVVNARKPMRQGQLGHAHHRHCGNTPLHTPEQAILHKMGSPDVCVSPCYSQHAVPRFQNALEFLLFTWSMKVMLCSRIHSQSPSRCVRPNAQEQNTFLGID
jgi:hypothetical protein